MISLTTLSCLGGGGDRSQCSDWPLIALQWAELADLPMSVLRHIVVSIRECERLYIRPVFDWCGPVVTGSLLFIAPVRRQAAASSCGVVLGSPQVSAGVLLRAEDCGFLAVSVAQPASEMATGSGRQDADSPRCTDPVTHSASNKRKRNFISRAAILKIASYR